MHADCWLSPNGKIYYGLCHQDIAERIIDEVYGINESTSYEDERKFQIYLNPERFLEEHGWMKYINRCSVGWWIAANKSPTQAQINSAFVETGDDVSRMGSLY